MSSTTKINHYSDYQVRSSQPGIEDAMSLVRANALESGASLDRMHLKVTEGSLAGRCLLWDQPSMSWVDMAEFTEPQTAPSVRVALAELLDWCKQNGLTGELTEAAEAALAGAEDAAKVRLVTAGPRLLHAAKVLAETSDDPEVVMETNELVAFVEGR